ncbi:unnamed protein product [Phytomonas sp. EM1]|nr:unnamed protein product [Phytomonas sp. EM1]|eukprot:CCW62531.1 unnamed protein product [Phytomonas sp. isolate EM1]
MSEFFQNDNLLKGFRTTITAVKTVWEWTRDRLWPMYTVAVVISIFNMIAISSEKQILADHFYGSGDRTFEAEKNSRIEEGKKYFNEEVSLAVKEKVWQMPPEVFKRQYASSMP